MVIFNSYVKLPEGMQGSICSIYHCFRIGHCTDLFWGLLFSCRFCLELTPLIQLKNMEVETCGTTIPTYLWAVALDVVGFDYIQ